MSQERNILSAALGALDRGEHAARLPSARAPDRRARRDGEALWGGGGHAARGAVAHALGGRAGGHRRRLPPDWPAARSPGPAGGGVAPGRSGSGTAPGRWRWWSPRGAAPAARAELRAAMAALRLAELREGVWLRPDNLDPQRLPAAQAVVATPMPLVRHAPAGRRRGGHASGCLNCGISPAGRGAREKLRREMDRIVGRVEAGDHAALGPSRPRLGGGAAPLRPRSAAATRVAAGRGRGTPCAPTTTASKLRFASCCEVGNAGTAGRGVEQIRCG